jgi:hypothetical protein
MLVSGDANLCLLSHCHFPIFPTFHTDSNAGGLFCSSGRGICDKSLFMCKIVLSTQSNQLDSCHLNKVVYKKNAVKFEARLFITIIIGIMLGDISQPMVL